jgi:hypothetical protein
MSRGGHNWKGHGTVETTRSLDVMKLARAGLLSDLHSGVWQWTQGDETAATISISGGRQLITLSYRLRSYEGKWQSVEQRVGPMDQAHRHLARLHRKLSADYDGPEMPPPPKPKWMRWKTYSHLVQQIEAGEERLDIVFTIGAQRLLAQIERLDQGRRRRRR